MQHVQIEVLADDLNRLAGWAVEPSRLATKVVLSEVAGVDPSLSRTIAGCIIRRFIVEAIRSFEGDHEYLGRMYDAQTLQRAFTLTLGIEQGHLSHPARVYRVLRLLGLDYSYDSWRKNPRLQRGLLTLLAEQMTNRQI